MCPGGPKISPTTGFLKLLLLFFSLFTKSVSSVRVPLSRVPPKKMHRRAGDVLLNIHFGHFSGEPSPLSLWTNSLKIPDFGKMEVRNYPIPRASNESGGGMVGQFHLPRKLTVGDFRKKKVDYFFFSAR